MVAAPVAPVSTESPVVRDAELPARTVTSPLWAATPGPAARRGAAKASSIAAAASNEWILCIFISISLCDRRRSLFLFKQLKEHTQDDRIEMVALGG